MPLTSLGKRIYPALCVAIPNHSINICLIIGFEVIQYKPEFQILYEPNLSIQSPILPPQPTTGSSQAPLVSHCTKTFAESLGWRGVIFLRYSCCVSLQWAFLTLSDNSNAKERTYPSRDDVEMWSKLFNCGWNLQKMRFLVWMRQEYQSNVMITKQIKKKKMCFLTYFPGYQSCYGHYKQL